MEDCKACHIPLGFRTFADPLPPALWASYEDSAITEEPESETKNSALIQDAFGERSSMGFGQLPLHTTELKVRGDDPYYSLVETSAFRYRQRQANCLAVGVSNAIRGAAVGSVFGGAMGKLLTYCDFILL